MKAEAISRLVSMLLAAATSRRLVSYRLLHDVFDPKFPLADRYEVLERAAATICDLSMVDYGVLMALDNGLPGDDFFWRYKRYRRDQYEAVMGYCSAGRSVIKRRAIVVPERQRVFEHSSTSVRNNAALTN
ncbi:hypothetical protein [Caballeronia sp. RCC_10]|uniref:hypothetical protein n=1 Tax=Caballeronia sp. RCC_10 TaxID=3239227 RepID=UPI0035267116